MSKAENAAKSVRMTPHGGASMAEFDDHLPIQRSFVERHIGQLVGIFQIDSWLLSVRDRRSSDRAEGDGAVWQ